MCPSKTGGYRAEDMLVLFLSFSNLRSTRALSPDNAEMERVRLPDFQRLRRIG